MADLEKLLEDLKDRITVHPDMTIEGPDNEDKSRYYLSPKLGHEIEKLDTLLKSITPIQSFITAYSSELDTLSDSVTEQQYFNDYMKLEQDRINRARESKIEEHNENIEKGEMTPEDSLKEINQLVNRISGDLNNLNSLGMNPFDYLRLLSPKMDSRSKADIDNALGELTEFPLMKLNMYTCMDVSELELSDDDDLLTSAIKNTLRKYYEEVSNELSARLKDGDEVPQNDIYKLTGSHAYLASFFEQVTPGNWVFKGKANDNVLFALWQHFQREPTFNFFSKDLSNLNPQSRQSIAYQCRKLGVNFNDAGIYTNWESMRNASFNALKELKTSGGDFDKAKEVFINAGFSDEHVNEVMDSMKNYFTLVPASYVPKIYKPEELIQEIMANLFEDIDGLAGLLMGSKTNEIADGAKLGDYEMTNDDINLLKEVLAKKGVGLKKKGGISLYAKVTDEDLKEALAFIKADYEAVLAGAPAPATAPAPAPSGAPAGSTYDITSKLDQVDTYSAMLETMYHDALDLSKGINPKIKGFNDAFNGLKEKLDEYKTKSLKFDDIDSKYDEEAIKGIFKGHRDYLDEKIKELDDYIKLSEGQYDALVNQMIDSMDGIKGKYDTFGTALNNYCDYLDSKTNELNDITNKLEEESVNFVPQELINRFEEVVVQAENQETLFDSVKKVIEMNYKP